MLTSITLLQSICAIYPVTGQEKETEAQREKPECIQGHSIARTAAQGSRFIIRCVLLIPQSLT